METRSTGEALMEVLGCLRRFSIDMRGALTAEEDNYLPSVMALLLPELQEILHCAVGVYGWLSIKDEDSAFLDIEANGQEANAAALPGSFPLSDTVAKVIGDRDCKYYFGLSMEHAGLAAQTAFDSMIVVGLSLAGRPIGLLFGNPKGQEDRKNPFSDYDEALLKFVAGFTEIGFRHEVISNYGKALREGSRTEMFDASRDLLRLASLGQMQPGDLDQVAAAYIDARLSLLNRPSGRSSRGTGMSRDDKADILTTRIVKDETTLAVLVDKDPYEVDPRAPSVSLETASSPEASLAVRRVTAWLTWDSSRKRKDD